MARLQDSWRTAGLVRRVKSPTFAIAEYRQPPGHAIPTHRHDRAGFVLSLGGAFRWTSSSRERDWCGGGALLIVPPGEAHSESVGPAGSRSLIVFPDPEWAAQERLSDTLLARWSLVDDPYSRVAAVKAAREIEAADGCTELGLEALLADALRCAGRRHEATVTGSPSWIVRVCDHLDDEYDRSHTLASLAAGVGVSRSLLAREFRRTQGMTVGEYLRYRRLERAAETLARSRRPLREVALDHGYYDQSHFTAAFRELFGLTPGAYRREAAMP